jgi:uncharacterized small protein (DUF1192 family)
MFDNIINEDAIEALPVATIEEIIAMLEKAGY